MMLKPASLVTFLFIHSQIWVLLELKATLPWPSAVIWHSVCILDILKGAVLAQANLYVVRVVLPFRINVMHRQSLLCTRHSVRPVPQQAHCGSCLPGASSLTQVPRPEKMTQGGRIKCRGDMERSGLSCRCRWPDGAVIEGPQGGAVWVGMVGLDSEECEWAC